MLIISYRYTTDIKFFYSKELKLFVNTFMICQLIHKISADEQTVLNKVNNYRLSIFIIAVIRGLKNKFQQSVLILEQTLIKNLAILTFQYQTSYNLYNEFSLQKVSKRTTWIVLNGILQVMQSLKYNLEDDLMGLSLQKYQVIKYI